MKSQVVGLCVLLFALAIVRSVDCNSEGDVLFIFRNALSDPNNVLASWDPTLENPCTWFHVTCNGLNRVIRVDLGNAGLSGLLVPQLGQLQNLQYLELYSNSISGSIPTELGNLKKLISLDLYQNQLTGPIPATLGNLKSLRFLRIQNNRLTGEIPSRVFQLVSYGNVLEMDVSHNYLAGTSHNKSKTVTTTIKQDASKTSW